MYAHIFLGCTHSHELSECNFTPFIMYLFFFHPCWLVDAPPHDIAELNTKNRATLHCIFMQSHHLSIRRHPACSQRARLSQLWTFFCHPWLVWTSFFSRTHKDCRVVTHSWWLLAWITGAHARAVHSYRSRKLDCAGKVMLPALCLHWGALLWVLRT